MLNIVIPMAGAGSRFAKEGYKDPKPLIPVHGIPMIKVIINNLRPTIEHRFIFICQKKHVQEYKLEEKLTKWAPNSCIIQINGITEGAACTVLAARELIDNNDQLMIANSDQYVNININEYLEELNKKNYDGLIMTMKANDPKWSFVGLNINNMVERVVEKEVISDEATVGIYNFKHGKEFVKSADAMIKNNRRVNNEFYVAPVYNTMCEDGKKIGIFNVGKESYGMYGLGIPTDLNAFLKNPISENVKKWN